MARAALILGVGNPLFGDDGFGIEAIRRMKEMEEFHGVELVDGGTAGVYLLPYLEDREHVIILDAVRFGGQPGEVLSTDARNVPRQIGMKLSEHQVTLQEVLALLEVLGAVPRRIRLIGVQPGHLRFAEPLSEAVEGAMERVFLEVKEELARAVDECALSVE